MEGFRPFGIPFTDLEPEILMFEEYEAIKLADYEGLNHIEAAKSMGVSRPTFTRIYENARRAIARAFTEGKAIFFDGGNYYTQDYWYRCNECLKLNINTQQLLECNYCKSDNLRRIDKK